MATQLPSENRREPETQGIETIRSPHLHSRGVSQPFMDGNFMDYFQARERIIHLNGLEIN